jgi:tetratricopeptide (TPR) repeat protein
VKSWYAGICCALLLTLAGCTTSTVTTTTPAPAPTAPTPEALTREGKRLYGGGEIDSAAAAFRRALALDSLYRPALEQQALMFYDMAMRSGKGTPEQRRAALASREASMRLARIDEKNADLLDRICELSLMLDDQATYLRYARKNAELFPYDRQVHNLALAYIRAGDHQGAIKVLKDATGRFGSSPYIAGFFRLLGDAYRKIGRDQTAERTWTDGVTVADRRLADMGRRGVARTEADRQRLVDDRIAMLQELKKLHRLYGHDALLKDVERRLKEAERDR